MMVGEVVTRRLRVFRESQSAGVSLVSSALSHLRLPCWCAKLLLHDTLEVGVHLLDEVEELLHKRLCLVLVTPEAIDHDLDTQQRVVLVLCLEELDHELHDFCFMLPERFCMRKTLEVGEQGMTVALFAVVLDKHNMLLFAEDGDERWDKDGKVLFVECKVAGRLCTVT